MGAVSASSDVETTFQFPTIVALGYGLQATDTLQVEANVEWLEFSRFDTLAVQSRPAARWVQANPRLRYMAHKRSIAAIANRSAPAHRSANGGVKNGSTKGIVTTSTATTATPWNRPAATRPGRSAAAVIACPSVVARPPVLCAGHGSRGPGDASTGSMLRPRTTGREPGLARKTAPDARQRGRRLSLRTCTSR